MPNKTQFRENIFPRYPKIPVSQSEQKLIQFGRKITRSYNKSSFLKIIGNAFRTDKVSSLSSNFLYW